MDEQDKSTAVVLRRTVVDKKSRYSDYREELRRDCWYACSYCTMTEVESRGIGFEIDHYVPKNKDPKLVNDYNNLFWSCSACNGLKGDYYPNEIHEKKGHRILRIDQDRLEDHMGVDDLRLSGSTETGRFNIDWLELNRLALRRIRDFRKRLWEADSVVIAGIRSIISTSIDDIDPDFRALIKKDRDDLTTRQTDLMNHLKEYVRNLSKSSLLDPDPEKGTLAAERRKYLLESGAITVDYAEAGTIKTEPQKRRRKK